MHELLRAHDGVLHRTEALRIVTKSALDNAVRRGALRRVFPSVYVASDQAEDTQLLRRAALSYAGANSALSHTTALAAWGLVADDGGPAHVMVPADRRIRARSGIVAHRRDGFDVATDAVVRGGTHVTRLEQSIVDSWKILPPPSRRETVIRAVGERMTTPERLRRRVVAEPNLPGRVELLALAHLFEAGCRSELEIWGHARVFRGSGMPRFRWQHPVSVGARTAYLDVYAEAERVNFELDGAAWHTSAAQRERDLRRDSALAAMGIAVVRFPHQRLTRQPAEVRREVLRILASRRGRS